MGIYRESKRGLALLIGVIALLCVVPAARADQPQPVATVSWHVYPSGGLLDPLQPSGLLASIPNPGAITISNVVTGAVVFSKPLSFNFDPNAPVGDVWSFDASTLPPGVYSYCGSIAAGDGFAGWQQCQNYATEADQLFSFQTAKNAPGLLVPLRLDPSLVGQTVQVSVTRYNWHFGGYTGWLKHGSFQYSAPLQSGQLLAAGGPLRRNQKAKITLSFPDLQEVSAENSGTNGFNSQWSTLDGCSEVLRGAISPRLVPPWMSKKKLSKPVLQGRAVNCS